MMYDKTGETMERADLEQLQIERLQTTLNRVYRSVAFYRGQFDAAKVDIGGIKTIADVRRLPFTVKEDLRRAYPYDMFAVPLRDIVRIHATSGTTGKPIAVGYTKNDVHHWSELVARQLVSIGMNEHDVVQVAFAYGLFTGGLGFHYGAERIGASVIPSSSAGNPADQLVIMKDYKATAIIAMPGYAMTIAHLMKEMRIHPESTNLKYGVFGAEPWSERVRGLLEERLHITAYDTYGVAEVMGPGVSGECIRREGLHINEDHFIAEIIDPRTCEPLAEGEVGELVLTTITKEGFPLIRYRTGDLTSITRRPCACGRTLARMGRVSGRTDDLLFVQGARIFPSQIQQVLLEVEGVEPEYQVVLETRDEMDTVELLVTVSAESGDFDEIRRLERTRSAVAGLLLSRHGLKVKVTFVEAQTLRNMDGRKATRVVDRRVK